MILLIDNYDSFTWNLVHFLGELGADTRVVRNDELTVAEALGTGADGIVLSPGPCTPAEAGICVDLVKAAPADLPILGVCLGHQSIGAAYGANVMRCHEILHGKLSDITHDDISVFAGLPQGFEATRYHSLVIAPDTLPDELQATARTQSGVIMGVQHRTRPVHGVQFHPESIRTEHGHKMLANFLALTRQAEPA
ncbi:MAG: aminodeoxychorismate/anthranilate synthase component II [Pseudomonadota bacterium]